MAIDVMRQLGYTPDANGIWLEEERRRLQLCWWAIARMDSIMGWRESPFERERSFPAQVHCLIV